MSDQITLLDVCKLPDVQIHSKTSLFKQIIARQNPEMEKIKDNIIKMTYTNKVIGVKGEEVGIISKRLPLKFKSTDKKSKKPIKREDDNTVYLSNYIPTNNFYAVPLPTVKKDQSKKQKKTNPSQIRLSIEPSSICDHIIEEHVKTRSSFRSRAQSMAKLRPFTQRKQPINQQNFEREANKNKAEALKKSKNTLNLQRNRKSFSNLLKQMNKNRNMETLNPISHEDNILFRKFQRLNEVAIQNKIFEEKGPKFEGQYHEIEMDYQATDRK